MAPLKFEDNIKEKLEQRRIAPSKEAWDKVSSQLNQHQTGTPRKNMRWMYLIAASIVGLFLITTVFYNIKSIDDPQYQIVDTDIVAPLEKQDKISNSKQVEDAQLVDIDIDKEVNNTTNIPSKSIEESKQPIRYKEHPVVLKEEQLNNTKIQLASTVDIEKKKLGLQDTVDIPEQMIQTKVNTVIAKVQSMQKNNIEVTEDEINQLLQQAQREITSQRIINNTNNVSATALLQGVEAELDETFKERVFEALKNGFQKVKEAVAERNQ